MPPRGALREKIAEPSSRTWWAAAAAISLAAIALRVYDIGLKPLHHDEGVNAYFLRRLIEEGIFRYDPSNYHGPTLPYLSLLSASIFGLNTFALRLVPILFGLGTVVLALVLCWRLGRFGSLAAGALMALSAGAVFHSRYFIHEMMLVFFTLALVVSMLRFLERRDGLWLLPAGISAALIFATKETCIITFGVLLIASVILLIDRRIRPPARGDTTPTWAPAEKRRALWGGVTAVVLMVLVSVVFYSSFFSHAQGVKDSLETFAIWAKTGEQHHVHPWYQHLMWLWRAESAILLLAFGGSLAVLRRGADRFVLFCALWGWGTLAAYSLVPYKTPWLTLNALIPLTLVAGYAVEIINRRFGRPAASAVLAVALVTTLYQSIQINFIRYDDETIPYVYAPTGREFHELMDQVGRVGRRMGTGTQTGVTVVYPDYWPMPWYLRDYPKAGFWGQMVDTTEPVLIGSESQREELEARYGDRYIRIRSYKVRNGLDAVLYVRRDVFSSPLNPEE
ncbi:MAG TPA: flippase activity-associated protein Agl23 [Thermoanaerobaculia bacterium]|nr:flippase activity-associated protein Agl23 [Thermoanaerobaculia bacterium]